MRLLATLLLLALAPVARGASAYAIPDVRLGKGYVGPVVLDLVWSNGTARPAAEVTGTVRVYSSTGTLLWTKPVTAAGSPANRMVFMVTATETARLGTFGLELDLVEAGVTDALHGAVVVEGLRR